LTVKQLHLGFKTDRGQLFFTPPGIPDNENLRRYTEFSLQNIKIWVFYEKLYPDPQAELAQSGNHIPAIFVCEKQQSNQWGEWKRVRYARSTHDIFDVKHAIDQAVDMVSNKPTMLQVKPAV